MAATYNGISFYILADKKDNTNSRPLLVPEDFGTIRNKIPYAHQEQIQFTGRGNKRFTLDCEMYSDSDFETLLAMVALGSSHTLMDPFGDSVDYTNMLLVDMKDVWRVTFDEEIHFKLTFEQVPGL